MRYLPYSTIVDEHKEICLTDCPYIKGIKIGDYECKNCKYFDSDDFISKNIRCKYEDIQ